MLSHPKSCAPGWIVCDDDDVMTVAMTGVLM
jgi:hypothetical protein